MLHIWSKSITIGYTYLFDGGNRCNVDHPVRLTQKAGALWATHLAPLARMTEFCLGHPPHVKLSPKCKGEGRRARRDRKKSR